MPARSPADATRFTSTGPHAGHQFTRSSSAASVAAGMRGGGAAAARGGETPQERIARLRESARKAKLEKITLIDKLYVHGRVWADRAHRATAYGLIGATFLCGGVTIVTLAEMIYYNRKLKKQYAEDTRRLQEMPPPERQAIEKAALIAAGGGPAAATMAPEEQERGKGIVANLKDWAYAGLTPVEDEYKCRFNKDGGADVIVDGTQTKWLPTEEGRRAEHANMVPEPGKFEQREREKKTGNEVQGRGMFAKLYSWLGR